MHETEIMDCIESLCRFEDRGPTKEGEREACRYLEDEMKKLGLKTSVESFKIYPHYYWVYLTLMVLGLAAGVISIWVPWAGFGLAVVALVSFWGDVTTRFHLLRYMLPKSPSQNLIGKLEKKDARKLIIVSAHYDVPRVGTIVFNPDLDEKVAKFYHEKLHTTPNVMMPMIIAFCLTAIVALLRVFLSGSGMWIGTGIVQGIAGLILLVAAGAFLDIATGHYAPGASDNASAVAACFSVAMSAVDNPLENSELWFLAPGCEESIMMGMIAFAHRHFKELDPENTYIINLETLGSGTLHYGIGEGFVMVKPYSKELVAISERLKGSGEFPEIEPYTVRLGTDAMAAVVRGFKAISLICLNQNKYPPHYHTEFDVPENIDPGAVSRAADFTWRMVQELDGATEP